jgi:hypothetical protein
MCLPSALAGGELVCLRFWVVSLLLCAAVPECDLSSHGRRASVRSCAQRKRCSAQDSLMSICHSFKHGAF